MSRQHKDPTTEQAVAQVVTKLRDLRDHIKASVADEAHVWFRNLLTGILSSALIDTRSVQTAESVYQAAWGRRNLLELNMITRYILGSAAQATDFENDLLAMGSAIVELLTLCP